MKPVLSTASELRAREIFLDALEVAGGAARAGFVDALCGEHDALRARVEALLSEHLTSGEFMSIPAGGEMAELSVCAPGTRIGRYTLLEKLGEGGCGVVYVAEQTEPVRRKVALKLIKPGMDTRQVIARFEAERQALALMDHPNIARVFDGGVTGCAENVRRKTVESAAKVDDPAPPGTGLTPSDSSLLPSPSHPYFVIELIQGERITDFCSRHALSVSEKLRLFIQVCEAVQHAHQKGVIHRDLKPSNILVCTPSSSSSIARENPVPKVIDFGVAKAVSGRLGSHTVVTELTQLIGTPAYMSPEQALLTSDDIDTRSDVYSLGVLLYELLTGTPPWSNQELLTAGLDEMRRIIREKEPERPSARVERVKKLRVESEVKSTSGTEKTRGAPAAPPELHPQLSTVPADLDWIVMKCLEKDRARRYETASALAVDLKRFLDNEPVLARPPSLSYRLHKTLWRHRLAFISAAAVFLSLLGGLGMALLHSQRAGQAEREAHEQARLAAEQREVSREQSVRAERERKRAEQNLEAMLNLTREAIENVMQPLSDLPGGLPAREGLARATEQIIRQLAAEPNLTPARRKVIGNFYLQLAYVQSWVGFNGNTTGQFEEGLRSAEQALGYFAPSASEAPDNQHLLLLSRAEMSACFAMIGLLRFDEAAERARRMGEWAASLMRRQGEWAQSNGESNHRWSRQLQAWILIRTGKSREALDHYLGAELATLSARAADREHASFNAMWDLDGELEMLGGAHFGLGHFTEAARFRRERLQVCELGNKRWPGRAGWNGNLIEARADLGEALLALGQPGEAETFLKAASSHVEHLGQFSQGGNGQVMLQVRVLRSQASGCIAWSQATGDSVEERGKRLDQAARHLNRAKSLIAGLMPHSLQKYLAYDLDRAAEQLQRARWELGNVRGQ